ncbi:MAG: hypothetical protein MI919_34410 [Holophagales bacterium]|nr:hypothetical protein [Holophagales bacterium]
MAKKIPGENPFASLLAETHTSEETRKPASAPRSPAKAVPEEGAVESASEPAPRGPRPVARKEETSPAPAVDLAETPTMETVPEPAPRLSPSSPRSRGRSRRPAPSRSRTGRSTRAASPDPDRENRGPRGGKILLLENGRTRANVYVQKDLWEAVREHARGRMSQSDVVEQALAEYLGFELEGS